MRSTYGAHGATWRTVCAPGLFHIAFLYGASVIAGQTERPGRAPGNIVIARFTTYTNNVHTHSTRTIRIIFPLMFEKDFPSATEAGRGEAPPEDAPYQANSNRLIPDPKRVDVHDHMDAQSSLARFPQLFESKAT
jgi:hypothetical protein